MDNPFEHFYGAPEPVNMVHGHGIYLYDSDNNEYIDCAAATFNLSLGYSHPEVIAAAKIQMDQLIHITSHFSSQPIIDLTNKLEEILPEELTKIHLKVSSGSAANEGAIKMAQVATGERELITFYYSHIGQTIYTMCAAGNAFRSEPFNFAIAGIVKVPAPYCYRCFYNQKPETCGILCAERIHDIIKFGSSNHVAAMIIEPIFGNGDNIVPPKAFMEKIRKICDEYHIALIFDEIQTGLGRTGHYFASQYYNVTPELLTMGKGLGGSGFQIAAIACKDVYQKMDPAHHSFTFGSNLLAAAAAAKTIEIMQRKGFLENVQIVGDYILNRLNKMKDIFSFIGDVRGVGLMIGIEIVKNDKSPDPQRTNAIIKQAFKNKLIMRSSRYGHGNTVKIRPALIITKDEAEKLCNLLEKTLREV